MFSPRNGQWVLFTVESPDKLERLGAFKRGESFVGIWQAGGRDALGNRQPGGIHVVSESGDTITVIDTRAGTMGSLVIDPASIRDCTPLSDIADIPPGRKIAEGWKPLP